MMFVHVGLVWSVEVSRFKDNNENGKSETKKSRKSSMTQKFEFKRVVKLS